MADDHSHSAVERRITFRLLGYWENLRRGRAMPQAGDIDPDHIADLWDYCFIIELDGTEENCRYRYLGPAIAEAYDDSPAGKHLALSCARLRETRQPILEEGEFRDPDNRLVKYRQCLLPLGSEDGVEAVFGGMRCKVFA